MIRSASSIPSARFRRAAAGAFAVALVILGPPPSAAGEAKTSAETPVAPAPRPVAAEDGRADDLVRKGNEARRNGRVREAIDAYRKARAAAPERYDVRIVLADTLRRAGRPAEAAAEFEAAAALDPARPEAHAGRAQMLRAAYDFEAAAAVLKSAAVRVSPEARPDLILTLAETRRKQGRLDEAGRLFAQVLEARPDGTPARAGLARVAEERGDLAGALVWWDRYLELKPDDDAASLRRQELRELKASIQALRAAAARAPGTAIEAETGRLLAVSGDAAGAVAAYRRAVAAEPRDLETRLGLALALRDAGEARASGTEFRRALGIDPADGTALYNLAALARDAGDRAAEEKAWRDLLAARPDDLFAARSFLAFLDRAGEGALGREIDRLVEATAPGGAPASPALPRRRAAFLAAAGRWPEAVEALHAALRADPTDPWTLEAANEILSLRPEMLGELARRQMGGPPAPDGRRAAVDLALLARLTWWSGRGGEALILARRAVAADPESAVARSALAEAYQRIAHDDVLALAELEKAVALEPARMAAHVDLALALLRSGRARQAESAARRGLALAPRSSPLLSVLGAALAEQGRTEAAVAAYASALRADPADNFGLARGQYPLALASLGRNVEARHALRGDIPPIPEAIYREAWTFARESYRDRTYNGQDWMAWRDRYRGALGTPLDACRAIAAMLASLGDPYTRLRDPEESAAVYLARRDERTTLDGMGNVRPHSKTVVAKDLPGGLGYIRLSNLTDPRVVAEVRRALQQMRDKEGILLDLRGNSGGFARSADAIGDLLAGPGKTAGVDVGPDGETVQVTGGDGALVDGTMVVLVDGQTGSAAERLARALAGSGRATLSGETIHGKGLTQSSRVLPGGMTVLVSVGEMLGPDGRPIQGHGLTPSPTPEP